MKKIIIALILTLALGGCRRVNTLRCWVNSISTPNNTTSRYVLMSGMEGITEDDLQFQELCKYLDNALKEKGYIKSVDQENTDIIIFLRYGIESEQTNQVGRGITLPIPIVSLTKNRTKSITTFFPYIKLT
ncbi:MAG: hypothetical protein AB1847_09755 [bacterium]